MPIGLKEIQINPARSITGGLQMKPATPLQPESVAGGQRCDIEKRSLPWGETVFLATFQCLF